MTSEAPPLTSIEEPSLRSGLLGSAAASHTELSLRTRGDLEERDGHHVTVKDGAGSVKYSLPSFGAMSRKQGEMPQYSRRRDQSDAAVITDSSKVSQVTVAIAEAVPRIAQEQTSAAEAYEGRWSKELQQSTATEDELRQLYQQLEKELVGTRRAVNIAEARHKRELDLLKQQLEQERTERVKAEQDREDLLDQARMSPLFTPRTGDTSLGAEQGSDSRGGRSRCISPSNAHLSDVFYDKLKEREERARARVRKEFVRQAQENLYAEQRKRADAEKETEMALKRVSKAEDDISKLQEALQEATSVVEAKDVQLHERAIHVQELEAQVLLLEHQLAASEDAGRLSTELAMKNLEEAKALADQRQVELETQRQFVYQLQEKIGLTTRDLFDRENDQEGVLRTVHELRTRCRHLEEEFAAEVHEATTLLEQKQKRAEDEAALLRGRNDELKQRCAAMGAELSEMSTRLEHKSNEVTQLRARNEKDLSECHIEIRSLQLQLERLTEGAQWRSSESVTAKEIERQEHAALVRQYAAEARAVQEELDRLKAQFHRENEKHLSVVLDLSKQITALKQENTQLEHAVNIREHDSIDAARLLSHARQELSQLREERRRMSVSQVNPREGSRSRSSVSSYDVVLRRIAELENEQKDLTERLYVANRTAQQPKKGRALVGRQHHHRSNREFSVPPTDSFLQMSDDEGERRWVVDEIVANAPRGLAAGSLISASSRHREATTALADLLESMVEKLQWIAHNTEQQEAPSAQRNSPIAPPTLQERRMRQSIQPEEREAINCVVASCMAALECFHLRRTSSPFYPSFFDDGAERTSNEAAAAAAAQREGRSSGCDAAPLSLVTSFVGDGDRVAACTRSSPPAADRRSPHVQSHHGVLQDITRMEQGREHSPQIRLERSKRNSQRSCSSAAADWWPQHVRNHRGLVHHTTRTERPRDHSPQEPLGRPRRSFQCPCSAVSCNEDILAYFSRTSATTPHPVTERAACRDTAVSVLQHEKREWSSSGKRDADNPDTLQCIQLRIRASVSEGNREELQSEPCWEGEEHMAAIERGEQFAFPILRHRSAGDTSTTETPPARPRRIRAASKSHRASGGTVVAPLTKADSSA
ncbi:hypothetical protein LPMP_311300 [Leishmania panamensis]|uniref:Uncharacterized protein n=1 Tax=Leishmania panamensis TaxID=5679 RepID=A0A088RZM2_LEIPA|nr:hypothetical protein LPMP_311300 [Leishmania panamensis]AIO00720.1 hypothetical protein LPMP_311300 [Leishmania panamensis]